MTYVKIIVRSFALLIVTTTASWAQSPPHQHPKADIIDGSVNPQAIPDSVAYRLYFVAVSELPTSLPSRRQHAHLLSAGLKENDIQATAKILASFKTQYAALIAQYNASPEVLNNTNDGLPLFLAKRDALVQETRDALKAALTPTGMTTLDTHIKQEKAMMKIAASEAQQ